MSLKIPVNYPEITIEEFQIKKSLGRDINPLILEEILQESIDNAFDNYKEDSIEVPLSEIKARNFERAIYQVALSYLMLRMPLKFPVKEGKQTHEQVEELGFQYLAKVFESSNSKTSSAELL